LTGRLVFGEDLPLSTWLGLSLIVVGGAIIQCGKSSL
jgi:multidrug transporter EmrE-like cation transporter